MKLTELDLEEEWGELVDVNSASSDGFGVELGANISSPNDIKGVVANGADGVGLYRTKFLYMGREALPSEEEQFEA
jgi:phosphoenolpyruvate-protein phosphotransferase (PTS system enzyme I)